MRITDTSTFYMLYYGHDPKIKPLAIPNELIDFNTSLLTLLDKERPLRPSNLESELSAAKQFLTHYCQLHKVTIINDSIIKELDGKIVLSLSCLIRKYNRLGIPVSPFDIPIMQKTKESKNSVIHLEYPIIDERAFLKRAKLHINYIELSRKITNITKYAYIHEIIHSQLFAQKGIVKDYYNSELLPIFFELLAPLEYFQNEEEYQIMLRNRLLDTINELDYLIDSSSKKIEDRYSLLKAGKYHVSPIKAFKLLLMYLEETNREKKEILNNINYIFAGKLSLEDFLKYYDITFENSIDSNIPAKLKKM